jgi:hypothetical protein
VRFGLMATVFADGFPFKRDLVVVVVEDLEVDMDLVGDGRGEAEELRNEVLSVGFKGEGLDVNRLVVPLETVCLWRKDGLFVVGVVDELST